MGASHANWRSLYRSTNILKKDELAGEAFFWSKKMAAYVRRQDEVKCWIDEDGDLFIRQINSLGEKDFIVINPFNIDDFINAIDIAVKEGYQGDNDEIDS